MKITLAALLMLAPLTSSMAQTTPVVAADDPTARFQGDGDAVKFDPVCKLATVEALLAAPDCSARLAAGDTAASIWATILTLTASRESEPLRFLERAIEAENHPAAHYLKASLLASGERLRPDPAAAFQSASSAADHRNPAAMDLLGQLYLRGVGVKQDVTEAKRWFARAAASGFGEAAINLALVSLDGRHQPVDRDEGLAVLQVAVAAGIPRSGQLLGLATAPAHNYQIEPTPTGKGMELIDFGMLDNPPIPPSKGFTKDLRALHYSGITDPAILADLRSRRQELTANTLFELSRRVAPADPQTGLDLFALAFARMTIQAQRWADSSAGLAVPAWASLYLPDIAWTVREVDLSATRAFVTREIGSIPAGEPWWLCYGSMADFAALAEGGQPASPYATNFDVQAARTTALASTDQLLTALAARAR